MTKKSKMSKMTVKIRFSKDEDKEPRLAKALEVFGSDSPEVPVEYDETTINLPNGVIAVYETATENIEGYELLKNYTTKVDIASLNMSFTFNWTIDYGTRTICVATVNKLLALSRRSRGPVMSLEDKKTLKDERERYLASKKG